MITEDIERKLTELFGTKLLEARRYEWISESLDDFDRIVDVSLIWIAELGDYGVWTTDRKRRNVIVAVMKAKEWKKGEWRKGVLLLPTKSSPDGEDFIGGRNLVPVDLDDDPVAEKLMGLDLTSPNESPGLHETTHSFHLTVRGKTLSAEIQTRRVISGDNENVDELHYAIGKVVRNLLEQYNRGDMYRFFLHFRSRLV